MSRSIRIDDVVVPDSVDQRLTTLERSALLVIPWGSASFSANVTTNNTTVAPSTFSGTTAGGVTITASGIVVSQTGFYACSCAVRCDTTAGNQIAAQLTVNGVAAGPTDIEIGSATHTVVLAQLLSLNAGDALGLSFYTVVAGTWYGTGAWANNLSAWLVSR